MKRKILNILKFIAFVGIGILLFWLAYRDQDINEIKHALHDANYFWIGISLLLGIMSHISRAMRWKLLIKPLGYKPKTLNLFFAVMIMYLANLAFPRLGEVSRCGVIKKYEKISFSSLFGTVFIERIIDMILLGSLFVLVMILQFDHISGYFQEKVFARIDSIAISPMLYTILASVPVLLIILFITFYRKIKKLSIYNRVIGLFHSFMDGIKTIKNMKNKFAFIAHSLFIYLMYYLMIYVCFWAFDFTEPLRASPLIGLTVFVLASLGMVAPAPGGIGAWHIMAFETLYIYGITIDPDGRAFAFAVHGAMTLMLIVFGFISLIAIPLYNKEKSFSLRLQKHYSQ